MLALKAREPVAPALRAPPDEDKLKGRVQARTRRFSSA